MSFWQMFWESFILTNFFVSCFLFLNIIIVRKKIHISYFNFFIFSPYVMYLNTNKWVYNHVWLLNTIFSNKLQLCLVLFTYKLSNILLLTYFCASPFQPSKSSSKNSFHIFEASKRFCIEILRLGAGR